MNNESFVSRNMNNFLGSLLGRFNIGDKNESRLQNGMVEVSPGQTESLSKIGESVLFSFILKLIAESVCEFGINMELEGLNLDEEIKTKINDIINKKWRDSIFKIIEYLLLYGICPIIINIDNGEPTISIPNVGLYKIFVEYDLEQKKEILKFFWRTDIKTKTENNGLKAKKGFTFPYGVFNPNYKKKKDKKLKTIMDLRNLEKYSKNLLNNKGIDFVRIRNSDHVDENEDKKSRGKSGLIDGVEDPNVIIFVSPLGYPNPRTGGIQSITQKALDKFKLLHEIDYMFVLSQAKSPYIFLKLEKEEVSKERSDVELYNNIVERDKQVKEQMKKIEEQKREEKKKDIQKEVNKINEEIHGESTNDERMTFSEIIKRLSHKPVIDLPEGTAPVFMNDKDTSPQLIEKERKTTEDIFVSYGLPLYKLNWNGQRAVSNKEEKTFNRTVETWKNQIVVIFEKLIKYAFYPVLVKEIINKNKSGDHKKVYDALYLSEEEEVENGGNNKKREDSGDDDDNDSYSDDDDDDQGGMGGSVGENERKRRRGIGEEMLSKGISYLDLINDTRLGNLYKGYPGIISDKPNGHKRKRDDKNKRVQSNKDDVVEEKKKKKEHLGIILDNIYSKYNVKVNFVESIQTTTSFLEQYFEMGLISVNAIQEALIEVHKNSNPILSNALSRTKENNQELGISNLIPQVGTPLNGNIQHQKKIPREKTTKENKKKRERDDFSGKEISSSDEFSDKNDREEEKEEENKKRKKPTYQNRVSKVKITKKKN